MSGLSSLEMLKNEYKPHINKKDNASNNVRE